MTMIEISSDPTAKPAVPVSLVREMYDLLGANMTEIVKGATPDWRSSAEFEKWRKRVFLGEVQAHTSHLLAVDETGIRGFLSYTAAPDAPDVYLNEVQIRPSCRADGATLRCLFRAFAQRLQRLPQDNIRTYSNKANGRAHRLVAKLGFENVGETDRGYRYRMLKSDFVARFAANRK